VIENKLSKISEEEIKKWHYVYKTTFKQLKKINEEILLEIVLYWKLCDNMDSFVKNEKYYCHIDSSFSEIKAYQSSFLQVDIV